MSIRSFSSELKHNLSQTYDIFNDLKIIKSNGVCKGAYNQFERLPSCDQIQKVFRRQIRFIRHSLQEFSFPDLLITPLGKPLEEIINLVNTKENLNLETRFSIKTFNDLNRKIYYYPSYNNLKPIHNNTKLDIINEIEGVFEISILNKEPNKYCAKSPYEIHSNSLQNNKINLTLEDFICIYAREKYLQNSSIDFKTPTLITNSHIEITNEFFICYENQKKDLIINTVHMYNQIDYDFQCFNKLIL
ncbi:hypothetical protein HOJ01_02145 [bacterium]|jgi:hypothetical protein|nr:hypothetical protein [bacterium]MBT6293584.1 hypothetical protein [bacterium]